MRLTVSKQNTSETTNNINEVNPLICNDFIKQKAHSQKEKVYKMSVEIQSCQRSSLSLSASYCDHLQNIPSEANSFAAKRQGSFPLLAQYFETDFDVVGDIHSFLEMDNFGKGIYDSSEGEKRIPIFSRDTTETTVNSFVQHQMNEDESELWENKYFEQAVEHFIHENSISASRESSGNHQSLQHTTWATAQGNTHTDRNNVKRSPAKSKSKMKTQKRTAPAVAEFSRRVGSTDNFDLWKQKSSASISSSFSENSFVHETQASSSSNIPLKRRRSSISSAVSDSSKSKRTKKSSSRYRGVSKCTKDGRWQARIRVGSVVKYLGRFKEEIEAAKCYDIASHKFHGKRAMPNFAPNGECLLDKRARDVNKPN